MVGAADLERKLVRARLRRHGADSRVRQHRLQPRHPPRRAGGGLALHWRTMELRFSAAFGVIALVGAGSVGFHMTLRREWQIEN